MPDPTPLSPAAQAVLDAFWKQPGDRSAIAAALRAVADQVVPNQKPWNRTSDASDAKHAVRLDLLAIAAELEGHAGTVQTVQGGLHG